jgi:hypothetical protein
VLKFVQSHVELPPSPPQSARFLLAPIALFGPAQWARDRTIEHLSRVRRYRHHRDHPSPLLTDRLFVCFPQYCPSIILIEQSFHWSGIDVASTARWTTIISPVEVQNCNRCVPCRFFSRPSGYFFIPGWSTTFARREPGFVPPLRTVCIAQAGCQMSLVLDDAS